MSSTSMIITINVPVPELSLLAKGQSVATGGGAFFKTYRKIGLHNFKTVPFT